MVFVAAASHHLVESPPAEPLAPTKRPSRTRSGALVRWAFLSASNVSSAVDPRPRGRTSVAERARCTSAARARARSACRRTCAARARARSACRRTRAARPRTDPACRPTSSARPPTKRPAAPPPPARPNRPTFRSGCTTPMVCRNSSVPPFRHALLRGSSPLPRTTRRASAVFAAARPTPHDFVAAFQHAASHACSDGLRIKPGTEPSTTRRGSSHPASPR